MHYYSHHIDSYTSATRHLLPLEDLAYRRMLDVYYRHEQPLQGDAKAIARRIDLRDQVAEVQAVLEEFFTSTADGWRQSRADAEIAAYQQLAAKNRANGARGGRPPATHPEPTGNPLGSESVASGNPPNPNPVPQSPVLRFQSPPRTSEVATSRLQASPGEGMASPEEGTGERGDPAEAQAVFALLCATPLRSQSKNRRQILDELAGAVVADGMGSDQARRLIAKARAETRGDYGALLGEWFRPGHWREKWAEITSGKVGSLVAGLAARRRAQ